MEEVQGTLITVDRLAADFRRLGVQEGMTLLMHSSFKSLGQWVAGGPVAVILALEQVLGEEGTLVMPTQSSDLTDPSGWSRPPVPEEWWPGIREHMPAYDPDLTPIRGMGIIPDCFRKQRGCGAAVIRLILLPPGGSTGMSLLTGMAWNMPSESSRRWPGSMS